MSDSREATMFKPVSDGYVFRAPNPWVFGRPRFYRANEVQKAQLLAIVTSRSQSVFWVALLVLVGASVALLAYASGHDDPTVSDAIIMLALIPVWIYAALLISIRPMARRLQPVLADLAPTDEQITSAEVSLAMRNSMSLRQCLLLGI